MFFKTLINYCRSGRSGQRFPDDILSSFRESARRLCDKVYRRSMPLASNFEDVSDEVVSCLVDLVDLAVLYDADLSEHKLFHLLLPKLYAGSHDYGLKAGCSSDFLRQHKLIFNCGDFQFIKSGFGYDLYHKLGDAVPDECKWSLSRRWPLSFSYSDVKLLAERFVVSSWIDSGLISGAVMVVEDMNVGAKFRFVFEGLNGTVWFKKDWDVVVPVGGGLVLDLEGRVEAKCLAVVV